LCVRSLPSRSGRPVIKQMNSAVSNRFH
jgi:hypothetical protein